MKSVVYLNPISFYSETVYNDDINYKVNACKFYVHTAFRLQRIIFMCSVSNIFLLSLDTNSFYIKVNMYRCQFLCLNCSYFFGIFKGSTRINIGTYVYQSIYVTVFSYKFRSTTVANKYKIDLCQSFANSCFVVCLSTLFISCPYISAVYIFSFS